MIPAALALLTNLLAPDIPDTEAMITTGEVPEVGSILLLSILGIVQFVVTLVFLWWVTRPSDPETNAYGPPPAA